MLHRRQLIREAAAAALKGKTDAGDRVYETRLVPYRLLELPAIAVYSLDESTEEASRSTAPRELERDLELAIEGAVKQGENVDDAMDALALEIERVMHADPTLGGVASDTFLSGTEFFVDVESDRPAGVIRLVYRTRYYTQAPDPADVQLDDFATADIRTSLAGKDHQDDQAHDRLENLND